MWAVSVRFNMSPLQRDHYIKAGGELLDEIRHLTQAAYSPAKIEWLKAPKGSGWLHFWGDDLVVTMDDLYGWQRKFERDAIIKEWIQSRVQHYVTYRNGGYEIDSLQY